MDKKIIKKTSYKKPVAKLAKQTSWGGVSTWYDKLVESDDSYQTKVIRPNLLRFIGEVKNARVLDLACGQGYFSRLIREAGADVVGVDISKELIAYAKQKAGDRGIVYEVSPAHKLPFLKDHSVDVVVCVLAFQNIENLNDVMKELARVLSPKGKIVLVLNHPAFRIPQASDWGFDDKKQVQYRREDLYLSEKTVAIDMNPGVARSEKTISFHRPLQYFFKMFNKHGFAVSRLEEWISHKASQPGPRQKAEDRARKEFPMFMAFELKKVS
jgi:ubiquinone/menaquinone biosynthesis C-methylase UbiE